MASSPGADNLKATAFIKRCALGVSETLDSIPLQRSQAICTTPHLPENIKRDHWSLDDFSLHKEIHKGKITAVYEATEKESNTLCVLKIYAKRKMCTLNKHQALREVRLHSRLDHKHIIRLYAAFEDSKHLVMILEHANGNDVFSELRRSGGQMGEQRVADILYPLLSVLEYLHDQGIVHRDIKPENVLQSPTGIKLADFGLAIDMTAERPVTRAGTLDYLAPEVIVCPDKALPEDNKDREDLCYTAKVDSWAIGILACELLIGSPPFEYDCPRSTAQGILYESPKLPQWLSADVRDFIKQALTKDAVLRPSIFELSQHRWIYRGSKPAGETSLQESEFNDQFLSMDRSSCPPDVETIARAVSAPSEKEEISQVGYLLAAMSTCDQDQSGHSGSALAGSRLVSMMNQQSAPDLVDEPLLERLPKAPICLETSDMGSQIIGKTGMEEFMIKE